MEAMERLSAHLEERPIELRKMRDKGVKIVGYTPGGFMPEELVHACGAMPVPVGLLRGGDPEPVAVSGAYIPRFIDTFCRSQIGYRMQEEEPLYQMIDLLVAPITDNNIRAIADTWDFYTDVEVFRFGVPHAKTELGFKYYLEGLNLLKEKLEKLTNSRVEDKKLRKEIETSNRMRELLQEISLLRKSDKPSILGGEFARLNHASFYADRGTFVQILGSLLGELRKKEAEARKPRILLTGSTLAMGDYKIPDMLESYGASVVIEEFCEGIRHYKERVKPNGDLIEALADRYFRRRIPCAFFRPSRERIDFVLKLAGDFDVDGIVWYQLMYRDSYDIESFYFSKILKEKLDIPMLKVQSDYDMAELGPLRTRVETFIDVLRKE